jgi:hypothetical protein
MRNYCNNKKNVNKRKYERKEDLSFKLLPTISTMVGYLRRKEKLGGG